MGLVVAGSRQLLAWPSMTRSAMVHRGRAKMGSPSATGTHCCGHDVNSAVVASVASVLAGHRAEFSGRVPKTSGTERERSAARAIEGASVLSQERAIGKPGSFGFNNFVLELGGQDADSGMVSCIFSRV